MKYQVLLKCQQGARQEHFPNIQVLPLRNEYAKMCVFVRACVSAGGV